MSGGARLSGVGRLYERPTLDVVVLILAVLVAFVMASATVTVAVLEVSQPEADTTDVAAIVSDHLGTIVGVLVGLIAGQATARDADRNAFR